MVLFAYIVDGKINLGKAKLEVLSAAERYKYRGAINQNPVSRNRTPYSHSPTPCHSATIQQSIFVFRYKV
jgi:hypothetical protein